MAPPGTATPPNGPAVASPRRRRLLRLHQEVIALHAQLTDIRGETARLASLDGTRPFAAADRRRVARLTLRAEGVRLELRRRGTAAGAATDALTGLPGRRGGAPRPAPPAGRPSTLPPTGRR
jgi:hypothetical protein